VARSASWCGQMKRVCLTSIGATLFRAMKRHRKTKSLLIYDFHIKLNPCPAD